MEYIKSKDNNIIKFVKKLKKKKFRDNEKMFVVEGFRFVSEALHSAYSVPYVFLCENDKYKLDKYHILELVSNDTKVYSIDDTILKDIASTENPQGIVAVVKKKDIKPKVRDGFYVLVDKIQDPGNMGTIIRTAHAAGAIGVITTKGCVDIYNEKTLRSTMGSIFKVPIIEDKDKFFIISLKSKGYKLIGSFLNMSENYFGLDLTSNIILCVGNEGNGISEEIEGLCDYRAKIPMVGDSESLNASVCAGIMIYEVLRQRLKK